MPNESAMLLAWTAALGLLLLTAILVPLLMLTALTLLLPPGRGRTLVQLLLGVLGLLVCTLMIWF